MKLHKFLIWTSKEEKRPQKRRLSLITAIKGPIKDFVQRNRPSSLRLSRKRSFCLDLNTKETVFIPPTPEATEKELIEDIPMRPIMGGVENTLFAGGDFSPFSHHVWYYGEMEIKYMCYKNIGLNVTLENSKVIGSILVRVSENGDVICSITYNIYNNIYVGTIPYNRGKYCLDFSDPEQPRFTSIKLLLAYLIEEEYLQNVSFDWLIMNCFL